MELSKKISLLRTNNNLTQEELASILFVSRTAISKWESGRGYPSIESIKNMATYFEISIDDLLSSEEILFIAKNESFSKVNQLKDLVFGFLDCSTLTLFVLPIFNQKSQNVINSVPLLEIEEVNPIVHTLLIGIVCMIGIYGILTLALQNYQNRTWIKFKGLISIVVTCCCTTLFILASQPYPAILMLAQLLIKGSLIYKGQ